MDQPSSVPSFTMSSPRKLAAIDLNLLPALDALLQDANVTVAGRRLGLSQPAMSHALARLRELLNDPLLVRQGRTMQRTEFARRLMPTIRRLVGDLEATFVSGQTFEPKTSQRRFRMVANDYAGTVLLPRVLAALRERGPRVVVDVLPESGTVPSSELMGGELDLVVGTYADVPAPLRSRELLRETFVCVLRRDHPVRGRLSLQRYVALDHLLVASPGYGPGVVDHALAARGLQRRVVARVPHFLVGPAIVEQTDLVLTLPRRIAQSLARPGLRWVDPPLPLQPFTVRSIWFERDEPDRGARWLRKIVEQAANDS